MRLDEDSAIKAREKAGSEDEDEDGEVGLVPCCFYKAERRSAHDGKSSIVQSDRMTDEAGAVHSWVLRIRDTI